MRDAVSIGHFIKKNNYSVDLVITSAALRAKSTATIISDILNPSNPIEINDALYQASARTLLQLVSDFGDEYKRILLVGHNPYISYFAEHLTHAEIGDMMPASFAAIQLNVSGWREVTESCGSLENLVHPTMID